MAINPICDRCGDELEVPGGLLFSPPFPEEGTFKGLVSKKHLCFICYDIIERLIDLFNRTQNGE